MDKLDQLCSNRFELNNGGTMEVHAGEAFKKNSQLKPADYEKEHRRSFSEPEKFWAEQAESLTWFKKWNQVKQTSFHKPVSIKWFLGAELNACFNCVDRHVETRGQKTALIWEADDPQTPNRKITYSELYKQVNAWAKILRNHGVKRGDRVTIYMPMIPESAFAMLACARLGAVHSVVFAGFAPESIADRVQGADSHFVITCDEGLRGGKAIPLKKNVDEALRRTNLVKKVFVYRYRQTKIDWTEGRDIDLAAELTQTHGVVAAEPMDAEDPLFLLYTSGSTNKPKGVLHTTGGYLTYANFTFRQVFDHREDDIFWCTADVGWITGHSYIVYGPLSAGATVLMFEGIPSYPDTSRFWNVIDKHQVTVFYTAPTALRALMREGDGPVQKSSRKSLRLLGSVGEPINPEAWLWYHRVVGEERCPIVDTWWQTETGGILISPLPAVMPMKPGSAMRPLFGIQTKLLTPEGQEIKGAGEGVLVLTDSWPGQMRTVFGDHDRFEETYFSTYPGYYFTGDGCRRDEDGDYWITGRVDDVLNVSGHRLGTAEVESVFVAHPKVAEAAIVGRPHDIKGQGIYAYVTLKVGETESPELCEELRKWVRAEIGGIASPDWIQFSPSLPKTRSGKIMRRILRKIAEGEFEQLGDISTLADPGVVEDLKRRREP